MVPSVGTRRSVSDITDRNIQTTYRRLSTSASRICAVVRVRDRPRRPLEELGDGIGEDDLPRPFCCLPCTSSFKLSSPEVCVDAWGGGDVAILCTAGD